MTMEKGNKGEKNTGTEDINQRPTIWRTPSLHAFQRDSDKRQCLDVLEEGPSKGEVTHTRRKSLFSSFPIPSFIRLEARYYDYKDWLLKVQWRAGAKGRGVVLSNCVERPRESVTTHWTYHLVGSWSITTETECPLCACLDPDTMEVL